MTTRSKHSRSEKKINFWNNNNNNSDDNNYNTDNHDTINEWKHREKTTELWNTESRGKQWRFLLIDTQDACMRGNTDITILPKGRAKSALLLNR